MRVTLIFIHLKHFLLVYINQIVFKVKKPRDIFEYRVAFFIKKCSYTEGC